MEFLTAPVVFSSTLTSKPSFVCKTEIHVSLQFTSHLTFEVMDTDFVDAPASNEREEGEGVINAFAFFWVADT